MLVLFSLLSPNMSAAKYIDVEANREHFPPLKLNSPFYSKFHTDRMLSFLDIQLIYVRIVHHTALPYL